jgi:hypothetical protein
MTELPRTLLKMRDKLAGALEAAGLRVIVPQAGFFMRIQYFYLFYTYI